MSFKDVDQCLDQAILVSSSHVDQQTGENGEISDFQQQPNNNYPQFNQSNILSDLTIPQPQQSSIPLRPNTRKSIVPQPNYGIFGYVIDNQKKMFDAFQIVLHQIFSLWYLKKETEDMQEASIAHLIDLQSVRRKLSYLSNGYNQTFNALKNCIIHYQEKVIGINDQQDQDNEDPYTFLSQSEIELRRALHEFFTYLDTEDPYASSKGMGGSQNMYIKKNFVKYFQRSQTKSQLLFELFNQAELANASLEKIAIFVLSTFDQEDSSISPQEILKVAINFCYNYQDRVGLNLLKIVQQLIQIWLFLYKLFQHYDINNVQFNFEIDQSDLNAMLVTSNALLYVPQDIYQKLLKPYSIAKPYLLSYSLSYPQKEQFTLRDVYFNTANTTKLKPLQTFINFNKMDQLLKAAENATKQSENFSFSERHSDIRDDDEESQSEQFSQLKYQSRMNKEKYTQTIMSSAWEITFKGRINESHLYEIQPPKHRFYITEAGIQWKRVCPCYIEQIKYNENEQGIVDIQQRSYFNDPSKAIINIVQEGTKNLYSWKIDIQKEPVMKQIIQVEQCFGENARCLTSSSGMVFISNPFKQEPDDSLFIFQNQQLFELPSMKVKRKNFGLLILGNYIYAIGGQSNNGVTNSCERYSIPKMEWQSIQNMNNAIYSPNMCCFQERYLIRIGGITEFGHLDKSIERYDTKRNKWQQIRIDIDQDQLELKFNVHTLTIQVNENQIVVLGGQNENGYSENSIQLVTFEERQKEGTNAIVKTLKQQEKTVLNFFGQPDFQGYIQENRIWFLRKDYSRL